MHRARTFSIFTLVYCFVFLPGLRTLADTQPRLRSLISAHLFTFSDRRDH